MDATRVADMLNSAAIHLLRRLRREDPRLGPSAAGLSALSVIAYGGPLTIGRLAEAEQVRSPTMTRIVDGLVQDGLVAREADPQDARRTIVRTTQAGMQVITEGRRRRVEALAQELESLPAEDLETLGRAAELLNRLMGMSHQ